MANYYLPLELIFTAHQCAGERGEEKKEKKKRGGEEERFRVALTSSLIPAPGQHTPGSTTR